MDRRERYSDPEEAIRIALDGKQAAMWTAIPAIVDTFDAERHTANVQPTIKGIVRQQDGTFSELQMPLLLDCPVVFPAGGGVTLTFPIKPGDEVLVVFASRCIDSWWALGGVQGQAELRMHDLSDGFVLPGVRSQPRKFSVSTTRAELRSDDGEAVVSLDPESHEIVVETPTNATVNAGGTACLNATHVEVHASESYRKDVGGYGEKITNLGGGSIQIDTYYTGATVTTIPHAYNPPEIP